MSIVGTMFRTKKSKAFLKSKKYKNEWKKFYIMFCCALRKKVLGSYNC